MKFLLIVTGYNCESYVHECIASIQRLKYTDYEVVLISDGSTDGTVSEIYKRCPEGLNNWHIDTFENNAGAAYRRYKAIKQYCDNEETVIMLIGMDDRILPMALIRIEYEYSMRNAWMTYGNWINQFGRRLPQGFLKFDEETHESRDYRKVKYRSTAPNTFKRFLFDQLTEEDFKIDGQWINTTTESALMFACLEMCGKQHIGMIEDPIYVYNEHLPNGSLNRLGKEYKYLTLQKIMAREKKPLLIR